MGVGLRVVEVNVRAGDWYRWALGSERGIWLFNARVKVFNWKRVAMVDLKVDLLNYTGISAFL